MTMAGAAPAPPTRGARGFTQLARMVEAHTGIKMPDNKRLMVEGRLRKRLRHLGHASLDDYYSHIFDHGGLDDEFPHIIDAVTTNKTDFFREADHFDLLRSMVLPDLMARGTCNRRPLAAWSAACSTGAEVYTLAMVLAEQQEMGRGPDFRIWATDICSDVLRQASRAIYSEADIAPVPRPMRQRYLLRSRNRAAGQVRVVPNLRQKVEVGYLNLMAQRYPWPGGMDMIFCRNVLIYFPRDIQQQVLAKLCVCLRPGGYLFVGHSETLTGMTLPVHAVASALYRRV